MPRDVAVTCVVALKHCSDVHPETFGIISNLDGMNTYLIQNKRLGISQSTCSSLFSEKDRPFSEIKCRVHVKSYNELIDRMYELTHVFQLNFNVRLRAF
jgi:hypothetical protein